MYAGERSAARGEPPPSLRALSRDGLRAVSAAIGGTRKRCARVGGGDAKIRVGLVGYYIILLWYARAVFVFSRRHAVTTATNFDWYFWPARRHRCRPGARDFDTFRYAMIYVYVYNIYWLICRIRSHPLPRLLFNNAFTYSKSIENFSIIFLNIYHVPSWMWGTMLWSLFMS